MSLSPFVYLPLFWLAVTWTLAMVFGPRIRSGGSALGLHYLAALLLAGAGLGLLLSASLSSIVVALVLAAAAGELAIWKLSDLNPLGQMAVAFACLPVGLYLTYTLWVALFAQSNLFGLLLALSLFYLQSAALLILLSQAHEAFDVTCRVRWRSQGLGDSGWGLGALSELQPPTTIPQPLSPGVAPRVCLLVPVYNEPIELVEHTVGSLSRLDYPNYEVLLVDHTNNPAFWRALERLRGEWGARFRSIHLVHWPGAEAGALNFALTQMSADTELVGIVETGCVVQPEFLRETVPYFHDPAVALVQTRRDYRACEGDAFLSAYRHLHSGLLDITQASLNERGAPGFAGSMGLVRASVLRDLGGWDEWCLTGSSDLSLRAAAGGHTCIYMPRTYGRGLLPLNFAGLKQQVFRQAFGGVQVLKRHWLALLPWARIYDPGNKLTARQRYAYLAGGLRPFLEPLVFVFTLVLLVTGGFYMAGAGEVIAPLAAASIVVPAAYAATGLLWGVWALKVRSGCTWLQAFAGMRALYAVGWAAAQGSVQALLRREGVFLRILRHGGSNSLAAALRSAVWEAAIGALAIASALGLCVFRRDLLGATLAVLAFWLGASYLAAVEYALLGLKSETGNVLAGARREAEWESLPRRLISERRTWALAGVSAMLLFSLLYLRTITPTPAQPPLERLADIHAPLQALDALPVPREYGLIPVLPAATQTPAQAAPAEEQPVAPVVAEAAGQVSDVAAVPLVPAGGRVDPVPTTVRPGEPADRRSPIARPGHAGATSIDVASLTPAPAVVSTSTPRPVAPATATLSAQASETPAHSPTLLAEPSATPSLSATPTAAVTLVPTEAARTPSPTGTQRPTGTRTRLATPRPASPTSTRLPASTPVPATATMLPAPTKTPATVPVATSTPTNHPLPIRTLLPTITLVPPTTTRSAERTPTSAPSATPTHVEERTPTPTSPPLLPPAPTLPIPTDTVSAVPTLPTTPPASATLMPTGTAVALPTATLPPLPTVPLPR